MEWLVVMLVSVLALIAVGVMAKQRRAEREQLARLEAQTQAIMRQYGAADPSIDPRDPYPAGRFSTPRPGEVSGPPQLPAGSDPRLAEVQHLVISGDKIRAIKRYREITGVGLAEAKRVVDLLEQRGRGY